MEVLVSLRNRMAVILDLLDLLKVLAECLACILCSDPALSLLRDRHDCLVLDHCADVDRVMHATEDTTLIRVLNFDELKQLQPQGLQLVSIVLKQVKVVANCAQNLIKVLLELTTILLSYELLLWYGIPLATIALTLVLHRLWRLIDRWLTGVLNFVHQVVLFGVLLQLVSHCAHDILNLGLEKLL